MRKLILGLMLMALTGTALADDWCKGYERGYIAGYMKAHHTNLQPLTPLCPLKPLKTFGDPDSDYEFGYQSGFVHGLES